MTLRISTGAKNKQLGFSTNLITNGTFDSATTSWVASVATLTYVSGPTDARADVLSVGTAAGYGYQMIATEVGRKYMLSVAYDAVSGQTGSVTVGTAAGGTQLFDSGLLSSTGAWRTLYAVFTATSTTTYINLKCTGTAAPCIYYDSVELYDISSAFKDMFNLCFIDFYTGTQPATADTAVSGYTKIVTISNASSATVGLTWDDAASGAIAKKTGETWSGVCIASGTVGWGRVRTATDTGALSTTEERVDFALGTVGAQGNFSSVVFTSGATQTIPTCVLTLPSA